jgi:hypothetical protein
LWLEKGFGRSGGFVSLLKIKIAVTNSKTHLKKVRTQKDRKLKESYPDDKKKDEE